MENQAGDTFPDLQIDAVQYVYRASGAVEQRPPFSSPDPPNELLPLKYQPVWGLRRQERSPSNIPWAGDFRFPTYASGA